MAIMPIMLLQLWGKSYILKNRKKIVKFNTLQYYLPINDKWKQGSADENAADVRRSYWQLWSGKNKIQRQ